MPIHTKKEFSELCGMQSKDLAVYIKRGKVIAQGDYIDDKIAENKLFLEKRKILLEKKAPQPKAQKKEPEKKAKPEIVVPERPRKKMEVIEIPETSHQDFDEDDDDVPNDPRQLEIRKKQADLIKTREETDILQLKKAKLTGVVIPTIIVKNVFAQHFKSVTAAFHQSADNLLMEIGKLKDLDREEMAYLRGKLVDVINKAVDDSIKDSKKTINNIVEEYSERRGVGERT